jgi:hypothetical protein
MTLAHLNLTGLADAARGTVDYIARALTRWREGDLNDTQLRIVLGVVSTMAPDTDGLIWFTARAAGDVAQTGWVASDVLTGIPEIDHRGDGMYTLDIHQETP